MASCTTPQTDMLCARCRACINTTSKDALRDDLWKVCEVSPDRASAPNAKVCRAALKAQFGSKRGRELIEDILSDRVVPGTKAYDRRHLMFLDKQPLRLIQQSSDQ